MPGSSPCKWSEIADAISTVSEQRRSEGTLEDTSLPLSRPPVTLPPPYLSIPHTLVVQAWGRTLQQIRAAQAALWMLEEICLIQMTRSSSGWVSDDLENVEEVSETLREIRESMEFFR